MELTAGANAGPLWIGLCDFGGVCDIVLDGSFHPFRSRPRSEELSRILDEGRRLPEAEGPGRRFFLDAEGRQRSFPRVSDRVGLTEGVATQVSHDETAQAGFPDSLDTLWVSSYPLDDDFGQIVEASSVLHAIGDRCLSRGGSCVRLLSAQEVGELRGRVLEKLAIRQTNLSQWLRDDLRICWIDTDETGSRFKTWRNGKVQKKTSMTALFQGRPLR